MPGVVVGSGAVGVGVLAPGTGVVGASAVVRGAVVLCFESAAAPAATAPAARNAASSARTVSGRQLGRSPREPGSHAPHCRHHCWPSCSGAPQCAHVGVGLPDPEGCAGVAESGAPSGGTDGPGGPPAEGGCSVPDAAGGSASNVFTAHPVYPHLVDLSPVTPETTIVCAYGRGAGGPPGAISRPVGRSFSSSSSCQ